MSDLQSAQATLDAYSAAIQTLMAAAGPAVVRVQAANSGKRRRKHGQEWHPGRARTNHGSGFVIDAAAGHIVTNFHVVRHTRQVVVHLHDGTALPGAVIGSDADADLAVIKVTADNLTALEWGDTTTLPVGSHVVALGNPDGDSVVVTSGIVSALDRKLRGPSGRLLEGLIQTDTLFNPGMSGGPLLNSAGQVVGINTASLVEAQGVNLAINSSQARKLIADLTQYGAVRRPLLGIAGERQRLYEGLVRHHQLQQTHGVYVHEVRANYPADKAGIQPGDVLITADKTTIEGLDDLHRQLNGKQTDDTLQIRLLRELELIEVNMPLEMPDDTAN
ncbi:S1C family serine protease [Chloroflexota bacterium]